MKKIKFGFPKGSLQDATVELFRKAVTKISVSLRSYYLISDDDDL
jgi:ATP phosphoribosyltransferase